MLAGQVAYARFRGVPSFVGLDPSCVAGDADLPTLRLVILGDSTVTAPGIDDADATWSRLVVRHLSARYHVEFTCLAEGGAKALDVVEDQLPQALEGQWNVAIVSVGSNDIMRFVPVWRFEQRLDHIVARLQEVADEVILFGVGDLGSIPRLVFPLDRIASGAGHIADLVHRRVAARRGVAKIDQWRLTTAAFNSGIHMFAPDLFHPSPAGHRAWADALIPTVDQVVAKLEAAADGHPEG